MERLNQKSLHWGEPLSRSCKKIAEQIPPSLAFGTFCLMVSLPRGIPDDMDPRKRSLISKWRNFRQLPKNKKIETLEYVMPRARVVFEVYELTSMEITFWTTFLQKALQKKEGEKSVIKEDDISLFETGSFSDDLEDDLEEDDLEDELEDDLESKEIEPKEISELDGKISALSEMINLQNQKISFIDDHFVKMQKAFMVLFGGSLKDDEARRSEGDIAP